MSAIWGTISFHKELPSCTEEKLRSPYEHYKIDRFAHQSCPGVCMGCGIQYITSQSRLEPLPIYDKRRGILFTADCYLDNRKELLEQLSPEDSSLPDGALMYLAYQQWGMDCLTHFLGSFCFALYHLNSRTLYLAADHTASRCLYYYPHGDGITFSTLLKPIQNLHPKIKKDSVFLKDYLCAPNMTPFLSPEDTPYVGVKKLSSASWVEIREDKMEMHTYWDPAKSSPHALLHNAKDWGHAFLTLYRKCVEQTIETDQNVGICLSSGLDSASTGVLAAQSLCCQNKSLYAFSYVPLIEPEGRHTNSIPDESQGVMKIAEMYPNILTHFLNNGGKNAFDSIPNELKAMEIPFKAFVNLPNLLEIGEKAGEAQCRILLTGQYGNSTVSYGEFPNILYHEYSQHHFAAFLSLINRYGKSIRFSRKKLLQNALTAFRAEKKAPVFHCKVENPFLNQTVIEDYPMEARFHLGLFENAEKKFFSQDDYRKILFSPVILTYLGEMETKSGLLNGILLRDPTRDKRIIEFCFQLPYRYFCFHGIPRWLIRSNFRGLLPASLLDQWQKRGIQNADWLQRFQRDWKYIAPVLYEVLSDSPLHSLFNWNEIDHFFNSSEKDCDTMDALQMKYLIYLYIAALT